MLKKNKNIRGESLLELIIALVIFSMSITIAGTILGSALRNMQNAKNRIVAVNIAREGVEAVRNIRDTNWLKFHSKRRECWNQIPSLDPDDPCDPDKYIESGHYIIYKQGGYPGADSTPTYRWRLGELEWGGILPGVDVDNIPPCPGTNYYHNTTDTFTYKCNAINQKWENLALLSHADIDPMIDTDGDGKYDNDADLYNHMNLGPADGNPLGESIKETVFTRVITIEYLDNDGVVADPGDVNVNRMRVTSTVSWISGSHTFKVELVTHLTDYLGRERLAG